MVPDPAITSHLKLGSIQNEHSAVAAMLESLGVHGPV